MKMTKKMTKKTEICEGCEGKLYDSDKGCGHKDNEDCMSCACCGRCREDLDDDGYCDDCQGEIEDE